MGVPAIVGTNNATREIKSGDVLSLDLKSGQITIVESTGK